MIIVKRKQWIVSRFSEISKIFAWLTIDCIMVSCLLVQGHRIIPPT